MSSLGKAMKFIELMKKNGWKGSLKRDDPNDYACLIAHRGDERLEISWTANQLTFPPKYEFAGTRANLHSAAVARRHIEANGPDIKLYMKRRRRKVRVARKPVATSMPRQNSKGDDVAVPAFEQHTLPFDIHESSDKEILRVIRGSQLIWINRLTGQPESAHVPVNLNRDLQNTFFLADNAKGRTFVSFMSSEGVFRAVYLDAILQVR